MKHRTHDSASATPARSRALVKRSARTERARGTWVLQLLPFLTAFGCAANSATNARTQAPVVALNGEGAANGPSVNRATAETSSPKNGGAKPLPQAVSALAAEGVTGAVALFDSGNGALYCSDDARCTREYLPASTFKVPLTAIGLETGVVNDAESVLHWDGQQYSNPDWNRDNTLRSAVQVSCEPCFRGIAQRIGAAALREWVTRLDYGNHETGGGSELFWLRGALRITPFQQLDFLRRLDAGKLPLSERTLDVVRDVITLDVGPDYVLRGKIGSAHPPDEVMEVGWFVGYVEQGERRMFFATVLDGHSPGVDPAPVRRRVTERVLRDLGALPAQ